jgi:hypothetical protein
LRFAIQSLGLACFVAGMVIAGVKLKITEKSGVPQAHNVRLASHKPREAVNRAAATATAMGCQLSS